MDFQHRPGGKTGSGGVASSSESNRDRRERLRQLALETIDINKVGVWRLVSPSPPIHLPSMPQALVHRAGLCGVMVRLFFPRTHTL